MELTPEQITKAEEKLGELFGETFYDDDLLVFGRYHEVEGSARIIDIINAVATGISMTNAGAQ